MEMEMEVEDADEESGLQEIPQPSRGRHYFGSLNLPLEANGEVPKLCSSCLPVQQYS
jgi:hypothetical protein